MNKENPAWLDIQESFREMINLTNSFDVNDVKTIAGVDLAYWKKEVDGKEKEYAVCCIVVIDIDTLEVIEKKHSFGEINAPYVPGFLAFRELPLVLETANKLETIPDIYMLDGNGYLHPRHMGEATHASFYLKKPTIGVAKTYYKIADDLLYEEPSNEAYSYTNIVYDGEIYGRALRTHENVKPIFVSCGNYIDLDTATNLTKKLVTKDSHIPLPTRLADIETHIQRDIYSKT